MVNRSDQNFLMWHWTWDRIYNIPFENASSQKKLLQESEDKMFIIISNTTQSKMSSFTKIIWDNQDQLEFVATIV